MLKILVIDPTVFFIRDGNALRQLVRLVVGNGGNAMEVSVVFDSDGMKESLSLGEVAPGETEHEIYLPDIRDSTEVTLSLWAGGVLQDEKFKLTIDDGRNFLVRPSP